MTLCFGNGETIQTKNLIWAAGVSAKVFEGIPLERTDGKRMATNAFNKVIHTENIFAIGDTCIQLTDMGFQRSSASAQVAIQQGINLAENFANECQQIIKTF
jgi:NADH dehydrogenase